MRAEIIAAFEKNIAFSCLKCYNWYILKTEGEKRPCQDRHGAVGFVAHHKSRHFAPTGGREYRANPADTGRVRGHSAG